MAEITVDSEAIVLHDLWPGAPAHNLSVPTDGFTGATHHNVATAAYKVGTKIQVYNETLGVAGFSTFIYLQIDVTSAPTLAFGHLCVQDVAGSPYRVTNDPDANVVIAGLPLAVAISAMATDAYYGWFWCGGVCPEDFVGDLGTTYKCLTGTIAGAVGLSDLTSADQIGFCPLAAATDVAVGYIDTNAA